MGRQALVISFSGLDGAGKSTLIAELSRALESSGRSVTRFAMYEDVGLYSAIRRIRRRWAGLNEHEVPRAAFRSQTAQQVIHGPFVTAMLLPVDLALFVFKRRLVMTRTDVLILDRYFYDSVVELQADVAWWGRVFLKLLPAPDISVFVDVDPAVAFARKGEYNIPELSRREYAYRRLFNRLRHAVTIRNDSLDVSKPQLLKTVFDRLTCQARPAA